MNSKLVEIIDKTKSKNTQSPIITTNQNINSDKKTDRLPLRSNEELRLPQVSERVRIIDTESIVTMRNICRQNLLNKTGVVSIIHPEDGFISVTLDVDCICEEGQCKSVPIQHLDVACLRKGWFKT